MLANVEPAGQHLGYTIGLWLFGALLVVALIATGLLFVLAYRDRDKSRYHAVTWPIPITAFIGALVLVGILFMVAFPFDPTYHQYYKVSGKVEQTGSRQIADGKGMSTRYVFVIGGQPYGVDDTRAALTKVGDDVRLTCSKQYQYDAESGWACNWGWTS